MKLLSVFQTLAALFTGVACAVDGQATFYGGNVEGGTCSFSGYKIPNGLYGVAMTSTYWVDAWVCGGCLKVTGPKGNSVVAMIIDQCANCGPNHIDLFADAFAALDDPAKGIIKVKYEFVPCGISSDLHLRAKEGSTRYWFSMQVVNANYQIDELKVSTDGGRTWRDTFRKFYNFFEIEHGTGTDSVSVKLRCSNGKYITADNVNVNNRADTVVRANC